MRPTIRAKLIGGFGLVLVIMIVMAAVAYSMSNQVQEANQEALDTMEEIEQIIDNEVAHLDWINELGDVFTLETEFEGELDHTQCGFGEWYFAFQESEEFGEMSPQFQEIFREIEEPHRLLHESAEEIVHIIEAEGFEEGQYEALEVYQGETQPHLAELRGLLNDLTAEMEQERDAVIAQAADQGEMSQRVILITTAIAIIVGLFLAIFLSQSIRASIDRIINLVRRVKDNDLQGRIGQITNDECGDIASNLNEALDSLNSTLIKVEGSSRNVENAAEEISSGNQDLSQRTEEQASSLEEISSTVEEVNSSLEETVTNAGEADNLASHTLQTVEKGQTVVQNMQGAMEEITQSSQQIAEIIAKVNDISFQTNLLALNAAVEAARAGEQGRGFAVVAAEVRNLAGRSAESAKEIENLINDSITKVEKGNEFMNNTEEVLQEIVENTKKTTTIVSEISGSLSEQSTAVGDIRSAIEELNQVTQQNASLVEEIASSSESMSSEAVELGEYVDVFKLDEGKKDSQKRNVSSSTAKGKEKRKEITGSSGNGEFEKLEKSMSRELPAEGKGSSSTEDNEFEKF